MWLASSPEASSRYLSEQKGVRTEHGDVTSENAQGQLGTIMLDFGIWSEKGKLNWNLWVYSQVTIV